MRTNLVFAIVIVIQYYMRLILVNFFDICCEPMNNSSDQGLGMECSRETSPRPRPTPRLAGLLTSPGGRLVVGMLVALEDLTPLRWLVVLGSGAGQPC